MKRPGLLRRTLWVSFCVWVVVLYASLWMENFSNIDSPVPPTSSPWRLLTESVENLLVLMTLGLPYTIWLFLAALPPVVLALWIKDRLTRRKSPVAS